MCPKFLKEETLISKSKGSFTGGFAQFVRHKTEQVGHKSDIGHKLLNVSLRDDECLDHSLGNNSSIACSSINDGLLSYEFVRSSCDEEDIISNDTCLTMQQYNKTSTFISLAKIK